VQATKYVVQTNAVNLDPYNSTCGSTGGTNGTLGCTGGTDDEPSSTASPTYTSAETLDNTALQAALNACPVGEAVELIPGSGGQMAFVASPFSIPTGVSLTGDTGIILYGSRNRADYGGTNCGVVTTGSSSCTPLITIAGNGSGIYGDFTINGRGWDVFVGHTTDSWYSGRIQAYCNENGGPAHGWPTCTPNGLGNNSFGPDMLVFNGATNCTVYKTTLKDSGDFAASLKAVNGCTFWGVDIIAPFEVLNTDGWDTDGTTSATFTHGNISVGDNHGVSKAASSPTSNISFLNNQTGAGIGYGVGSNTNNGVNNVLVDTLVGKGNPNADNSAGFLISSNTSTGGTVNQITYRNTCMVGEHDSVRIYTNYGCNTGTNSPSFQSLLFRNNTFLADGSGNSGHFTLQGLSGLPIGVQLDNFAINGTNQGPSQQCGITLDQYTNMYLGPGQVPSSITTQLSAGTSNTTAGSAGTSTAYPCTTSTWQPLIANLNVKDSASNNTQGPLPISAGPFVLQMMIRPATEINSKESPALTASPQFLDNDVSIGTATLSPDGSYASMSVSPTSGTHVYQGYYPGDAHYPAFTFGSVTISGSHAPPPPMMLAGTVETLQ
jgi:polygalacturonase